MINMGSIEWETWEEILQQDEEFSESRVRENLTHGLMRGGWKLSQ